MSALVGYRCPLCAKLILARPDLRGKPGAPTRQQRLRDHMRSKHGIRVTA